jgi:hypothetical protein
MKKSERINYADRAKSYFDARFRIYGKNAVIALAILYTPFMFGWLRFDASFHLPFQDAPHVVCRFTDSQGNLIIITMRESVWLDDVMNGYRTQHRYREILPGVLFNYGSLREVSTKRGIEPEYRCPGE